MHFNVTILWLTFGIGFILFADAKETRAQVVTDDSVRVDSVASGLPSAPDDPPFSEPYPDHRSMFFHLTSSQERTVVDRDTTGRYISRRLLFDIPLAAPYIMTQEEYSALTREHYVRENWNTLISEYESDDEDSEGLLDFRFDVPGGDASAFSTIFGRPEVNLSVNGTADMNLGAFIQTTENPEIPPDQQTQIDPTFDQSLQLNIQGTIGDKLSIQTDWDTERAFDFENRLSIAYEGYEDEILQQLEMGNVSMETGNSLIRGGSSLFGIKSVAQLGSLELTSVLSQQQGEDQTETVSGGSQEQELSIRPADYENDRHFFLDFYNRQEFEENMSNPQQLGEAYQISDIEVWVLRESSQSTEGERQAIAMVDYGVNEDSEGTFGLPSEDQDPFDEATLNQYRDASEGVSAEDFGVDSEEFVEGYFRLLEEGSDYEVNNSLGYISLKESLGSRQALAISFRYRDPDTGESIRVGDESQGGGDRIYLKLLRPQNVTTSNKAWDLMMKNVYSLGANELTPDGLDVDIKYTAENVPSSSLPQRSDILLQELGLDRVDSQGGLDPDNNIDFGTGTLDAAQGKIIFPYLEPFGERLNNLLTETGLPEEDIDDLVFDELYEERKSNANQVSKNSFYLIDGSSSGGISDNYDLPAGLVEGSVEVYANGRELQEGTDYVVDYSIGNVTILDDRYLRRGQEIEIKFERNDFAEIEQKSFTGIRAEYELSEDISLGTTYFRLKEQPLQDKISVGDEPVNNSVFGVDADAEFDMPWLTRAVDFLPLLQTTEPSSVSISGEFAQLRPDVAQTNVIEDAINRNELFQDEEEGLSFIDDFEGVDVSIELMNPSRWNLAAAPAAVPGYDSDEAIFEDESDADPASSQEDKIARSDLRSTFSWYSIPRNIEDILDNVEHTPETEPVEVTDVFPNRDVLSEENYISTLDIFYNPTERGPYNYNMDLPDLLQNEPERTWGGMVATLPSGQEDLTQNNIEFLEFWVQPVLPDGDAPTAQDIQDYDGKMYIDIGIVSEDVVPNSKTNSEDGLARRPNDLQRDNAGTMSRSYIPSPQPAPEGQFSNERRELEDVGLDGAPNREGIDSQNEQNLFAEFIREMQSSYGTNSEEFEQIMEDPSNDDYVYYGESEVQDLPLNERFHRMFGYHEGNTPANTGDKRAATNKPDTEGLITPSIVEQNNSYFQYEIDMNPADEDELSSGQDGTFIVDQVPGNQQQDRWYQVRLPLEEWVRKVGGIENFQNVSYIRVWLSGYEKPFTLRFATFELVGSQWRNAEAVHEEQNSQADFNISSINIEENSLREPIPYRQPEGSIRSTNRDRQRQTIANEQSVLLDVEDLGPDELKMVKRTYPGGLNMINYSNLRMFVHGEGFDSRGDAELVLRFGTDLTNNYYEYRQPVSPSDSTYAFSDEPLDELSEAELREEAEQVWLYDENSVNIILRAFNQLKQLRNQESDNSSDLYERSDILQDAPDGAVVAMRGNPSLERIGEIGMGIRNPYDPTDESSEGEASLDAEFWLNEMRVSGFDNERGWAASGQAEINFADFATFSANLDRETDGFGALNSRLGQRRTSDVLSYDLNTSLNMHKFLPERYGWNIPVTLSTRRSTSTPRFLPNQGDVRISELEEVINAREDLNETEKEVLIEDQVRDSQTFSESYSLNVSNVSKDRSEHPLLRYTVDKTTLNYVYNTTDRRNPEYLFQDNWNYDGSLRYNLDFENTRLIQPFSFLEPIPVLGLVSGLQLGYTPASITASAGMDREYDERRRRPEQSGEQRSLQQSHSFTYDTEFGFNYNLTPAIQTSFQSQTVFDLSRTSIAENGVAGTADSSRYRILPTFEVFEGLVSDTLSSRRSNYQESYSASWTPSIDQITYLEWVDYSANYRGGYQWRNSPFGSGLGANISNNITVNQSLDFGINELFGRWEWYNNLNNGGQGGESSQNTSGNGKANTLKQLGRGIARSFLSIQMLDVAFDISKNSLQSGYGGDSQLYYMFNPSGQNFSPPFSYRTGITDGIAEDQLVDNLESDGSIRLPSNKNFTDDLTVRSRFTPFENLSIDLNWETRWELTRSRSTNIDTDQNRSTVTNQNGEIRSSVWAFGGGYGDLFQKQLSTAFEDMRTDTDTLSDATGNGDGQSLLGKNSLQDDFRQAYLRGASGTIGARNFTPFPLPGWEVSWSGLERWIPLFGSAMARASLSHIYRGEYRLGWNFNEDRSPFSPLNLGSYSIVNERPEYEPSSINIEKQYQPLVGLNVTWRSNLRTTVQYEYSKLSSLALSNTTVTERISRGLNLSLNYTMRDFKIPFLPRIENAVDFTIRGSYLEDLEEKFVLNSDLGDALQEGPESIDRDPEGYDFSEDFSGGQSRINSSAVIGYQFSQMMKANFEYTFRKLIPRSTGVFPRTDHDIRFNVVVSIRSD